MTRPEHVRTESCRNLMTANSKSQRRKVVSFVLRDELRFPLESLMDGKEMGKRALFGCVRFRGRRLPFLDGGSALGSCSYNIHRAPSLSP